MRTEQWVSHCDAHVCCDMFCTFYPIDLFSKRCVWVLVVMNDVGQFPDSCTCRFWLSLQAEQNNNLLYCSGGGWINQKQCRCSQQNMDAHQCTLKQCVHAVVVMCAVDVQGLQIADTPSRLLYWSVVTVLSYNRKCRWVSVSPCFPHSGWKRSSHQKPALLLDFKSTFEICPTA